MQRREFFQSAGTVAAASLLTIERPIAAAETAALTESSSGLDFHTFREYPGQRGPKTMLFWDYWKLHHLDNCELVGKCIRIAVRFHNARIYAFRGDYHIIDGFDFRRINDGLPIDTTRFGA